jgi:hypothetical protein
MLFLGWPLDVAPATGLGSAKSHEVLYILIRHGKGVKGCLEETSDVSPGFSSAAVRAALLRSGSADVLNLGPVRGQIALASSVNAAATLWGAEIPVQGVDLRFSRWAMRCCGIG